jgi:glycosyltransferase involved in cell wall biosynthesis
MMAAMRSIAISATVGTFGTGADGLLAGRLVANTEFVRALLRHGHFEELVFLVGEGRDIEPLQTLLGELSAGAPARRLAVVNMLDLPALLQRGALSVLHLTSPAHYADAVWLRDRYARGKTPPVTAQIHSLSYPALMLEWMKLALMRPSARDALFCSSHAGRAVVQACMARVDALLEARGPAPDAAPLELPVVPLGIDAEQLAGGRRASVRDELGIPADAVVVLGMGRFTEFDKMDLFPVVQAVAAVSARTAPDASPVFLLLAGARQGTKTPEMVQIWANALGFGERLRLLVDFPAERKADILASADVFVSLSDNPQETFGLSVVEAMAAGLPVIASDYNGYKDTASDGVALRIPTRACVDLAELSDLAPMLYARPLHLALGQSLEVDLPALEAALTRLIGEPALRASLGRAATERARALYAWPRVIARYEAEWQRLATQAVPARIVPERHPLCLDYDSAFAAFPTERLDPQTRVCASPLAHKVVSRGSYPIYPELKPLFTDAEYRFVLALAKDPASLAAIEVELARALPERARWKLQLVLGWMLKHGLLVRA